MQSRKISSDNKQIYWYQGNSAWFAEKDVFTSSMFFKIEPYGGVLDAGMIIWNKNKEVDIYFDDLWMFMTLIDSTCPTIIGQYVDDSKVLTEGKLRICVRYSEPVYSSKKNSLTLYFPYYADYVDGNYTETLVYEVNAPKLNINGFVFVLFPALVAKMLSI